MSKDKNYAIEKWLRSIPNADQYRYQEPIQIPWTNTDFHWSKDPTLYNPFTDTTVTVV